MSSNTHVDILLAGAFAAFTVDLLIYPLDTLKTRFQSPDYQSLYYNASKSAINKSLLFRGLYQGVGSVILITIPSSGAFFITYETTKSLFNKINVTTNTSSRPVIPEPFIHGFASSVAELISCVILTPAEVLKQNSQMIRRPEYSKASKRSAIFQSSVIFETLRRFKRPSQLWRGYTALAARNLPFTAIQFPIFEHLKKNAIAYQKKRRVYTGSLTEHALTTGLSAGSAGSLAAVITTPVDVIKTRIMLSAASEPSNANAKLDIEKTKIIDKHVDRLAKENGVVKKSGLAIAREIMKESGVKGLFRGGLLRGAWTAIGSGLYLSTYEASKFYLERGRGPGRENEP